MWDHLRGFPSLGGEVFPGRPGVENGKGLFGSA